MSELEQFDKSCSATNCSALYNLHVNVIRYVTKLDLDLVKEYFQRINRDLPKTYILSLN